MTHANATRPSTQSELNQRVAIRLRGAVQGVGFRPFVFRCAVDRGLSGWVRNTSDGVEIEVEGPPLELAAFLQQLSTANPAGSRLDNVRVRETTPHGDAGFEVVASASGTSVSGTSVSGTSVSAANVAPVGPEKTSDFATKSAPAARVASFPVDVVSCRACLDEVRQPTARRFGYAFTTCSECGPRYSITRELPYDRQSTTLRDFPLCTACTREYHDPSDRRFHAEAIACPACGPRLELRCAETSLAPTNTTRGDAEALREAALLLHQGKLVALKGIGGYQLLVDATSATAVAHLRRVKARDAKPFALMFRDLLSLRAYCDVNDQEAEALQSRAGPIVLVSRRDLDSEWRQTLRPSGPSSGAPRLADNLAPDNPRLGVMLPSSPLHALLLDQFDGPLVCTSGNLSGEPLYTDDAEAQSKLGHAVDAWLVHDRPIHHPVDDSVVQLVGTHLQSLRLARGLAPYVTPRAMPDVAICYDVLALGAHLKSTVTLATGDRFITSAYLGDLNSPDSVHLLERTALEMLRCHQARPSAIACDLHPDYASTRLAEALSQRLSVPLIQVQHHHGHIAACRAEHDLEGPLLGLCWDGTGLGSDGEAWGGEALLDRGASFERFASLRSFPLPGGDRAAREPWRTALGAIHAWCPEHLGWALDYFSDEPATLLIGLLERDDSLPRTSSIGRLFDVVAALLGFNRRCTFEGQAAQQVQFAAERARVVRTAAGQSVLGPRVPPLDAYGFGWCEGTALRGDFAPLLGAVIDELRAGTARALIARRFINSLVAFAVDIAKRCAARRVALSGGCFQNGLLLELTTRALEAADFSVYSPWRLPANDGGISLGQAQVASLVLAQQVREPRK